MKKEIALPKTTKALLPYPTCTLISFMDSGRRHETPESDKGKFCHSNSSNRTSAFVPGL